jgi:hypothetical protein
MQITLKQQIVNPPNNSRLYLSSNKCRRRSDCRSLLLPCHLPSSRPPHLPAETDCRSPAPHRARWAHAMMAPGRESEASAGPALTGRASWGCRPRHREHCHQATSPPSLYRNTPHIYHQHPHGKDGMGRYLPSPRLIREAMFSSPLTCSSSLMGFLRSSAGIAAEVRASSKRCCSSRSCALAISSAMCDAESKPASQTHAT